MTAVYRAPMRARDRDVADGAGARHGVEHGLVGTGDVLDPPPATLGEAVLAAAAAHGDKAGRMLHRFANVLEGALVWTRLGADAYRLGRITGGWRYDDSPAARAVGIHHVRPATWLDRTFTEAEVPAAAAATFARGGRNFQRTHDEAAERETAALWAPEGSEDEAVAGHRDGASARRGCDNAASRPGAPRRNDDSRGGPARRQGS